MMLNGCLELFDILRAPFTEGSLCLAISLLPFFRRGIDLDTVNGYELSWPGND